MYFVRKSSSSKMRVNAGFAATCMMRAIVVSTFLIVSVTIFILVNVSNENSASQLAYRSMDLVDPDISDSAARSEFNEGEEEGEDMEEEEIPQVDHIDTAVSAQERLGIRVANRAKVNETVDPVAEDRELPEDDSDDELVEETEQDEEEGEVEDVETDDYEDEEKALDFGVLDEEPEKVPQVTLSKPLTTAGPVLEKRLPNCLIIGVRKAGTRPILHFLTLHPQVVALGPEVGFFSTEEKYSLGLDWYRDQMPPVTKDQVLIEKTADYFQSFVAPKRIHDMNSSIKIVLVVRDPVERMISDYYFLRRYAEKRNITNYRFMELEYSLEELLFNKTTGEMKFDHGGLFRSKYAKFMKNWYEWFPKEQIHVVDGDAFAKNNPAIELKRLEEFLGIKPMAQEADYYFSNQKGFWCLRKSGCMGEEKGHKFPKLNPKVEAAVRAHLKPFNQEFYRMMGHDYGWKH